jgi:CRISPR-associated protein Cmr3
MQIYTLTPNDVLFFRDGRPMEAVGGHGARWPEPSVIFDAVHAALHRAFPEIQEWEHTHRFGRSSDRDYNRSTTERFGALKTAGLFPVLKTGDWLFPAPLDIVASSNGELGFLKPLRPDNNGAKENLPKPLHYLLGNPCVSSKQKTMLWWGKAALEAYLGGRRPEETDNMNSDADLLTGEWTTGIAVAPATETAGRGEVSGMIYSAEYLRLRPAIQMGFVATLSTKQNGVATSVRECLDKLFEIDRSIVVGGQQRVCSVEKLSNGKGLADIFPTSVEIHGSRVKWLLLSPAIFPAISTGQTKSGEPIEPHPGGWLPTWVDPATGKVKLLTGGPGKEKAKRLKREAGREIDASLVAARIPKPVVITGWSDRLDALKPYGAGNKGARAAMLAVPPGAVYYFEGKDAALLGDVLSWHGTNRENVSSIINRRSTVLGEKGFGIGVCGPWDFYEDVAGRPENRRPTLKR